MKPYLKENHSVLVLNATYFAQDYEDTDCVEFDGLSKISKSIFISLSLICGIWAVGGNLALLVAFYRSKAVYGHITNYFVVSLVVSDLLIGLLMTPMYICYSVDLDPPWLIKLEGFLWILTVTATTHSLSAVSMDRLISILYPLRYSLIATDRRCRVVIALIWVDGFVFGFPRLILDDFQKLERLWVACSIVTVAIPILIMSSCYGKIFTIVKKQNGRKLANTFTTGKHLRNRKAAITIGIIVCLFIVTFIPSTVVYFMLLFEKDRCKELELNDVWLWVALVSFSHSAINPWVYGLRYRALRKALREQVKIH